jgi:hypothetical protein
MSATFASSIFSAASPYYGSEFGLSDETTVLGVSLFILGYVGMTSWICKDSRLIPFSNSIGSRSSDLGATLRGVRKENQHIGPSFRIRLFHCWYSCRQGCTGKGLATLVDTSAELASAIDHIYHTILCGSIRVSCMSFPQSCEYGLY